MLKTTLAAVCTIALLPVGAAHAVTPAEMCKTLGETAATVMEVRQKGSLSLSEMLEVGADENPVVSELVRQVIFDAYDSPVYGDNEVRKRAIKEFRNQAEMKCHRTMGS